MKTKVVTYQTDRGETINLSTTQIKRLKAAAKWPRNSVGREYCSVSHGMHYGTPTYTDAEIEQIIAE